ncbi:hypothetical protein BCR35DRAFT_304437 [Leucosporidium creatinivorum]|uniref:3-oxo-5-alpha-steroid 4-dehydrogenase C-terminal domain-containing protein n=1 Tax=Leucosporidium creatinivorum TaxID=106004 RepID=A0A1Y2F9E2_9BASI|nr:hypothetical protein BCR35DRAFT_304437 [Leucosporidium creatinivorum]
MELVSPLSLLHSAAQPLTTTTSPSTTLSPLLHPTHLFHTLSTLPPARLVLIAAFLIHYAHRSVISTLRNWNGRARMAWYVPTFAVGFNILNGALMGRWLAGGLAGPRAGEGAEGWGLKGGVAPKVLFGAGMVLWVGGFVTNVRCDEVLVRIKKDKVKERERLGRKEEGEGGGGKQNPKERYAIPYGGPFGLYDLVSHPSYFAEWVEWTGFLLSTLALTPSPFPLLALSSRTSSTSLLSSLFSLGRTPTPSAPSSLLRGIPPILRPMRGWYAQPPALFLWNEIACMLPRAISGHQWYRRTFGRDWPAERKIVIPYVF